MTTMQQLLNASKKDVKHKVIKIKSRDIEIAIKPLSLREMMDNKDIDQEGDTIDVTATMLATMVSSVKFGDLVIKGDPLVSKEDLSSLFGDLTIEEAEELTSSLHEVMGTGAAAKK